VTDVAQNIAVCVELSSDGFSSIATRIADFQSTLFGERNELFVTDVAQNIAVYIGTIKRRLQWYCN
jgi:hypothetical protein